MLYTIFNFSLYNTSFLNKLISYIPRFGYGDLAKDPKLLKFFMQGEKSGDILSGFLKKYDSHLVKK